MSEKNQDKPWWQSKTIVGALVTAAAGFAGLFGVEISEGAAADLTEVVLGLILAVAGGFTVYGRIKAEKKIK